MGLTKIVLSALALLLAGCSTPDNVIPDEVLSRDQQYEQALLFTKRAQLIQSFETKAAVTATLLNGAEPKRYSEEESLVFFVGLLLPGYRLDEPLPEGYALRLNGNKPVKLTPVDRKDPLLLTMPLVNRWSRYYLATFVPSESPYALVFENDRYGSVTLTFQSPTRR